MTDEPSTIILRAHHLLCMQGFQGYGYDKKFVDNVYFILSQIDDNSELELELVADCDDICMKCPNMKENLCKREPGADEKIKRMDRLVLLKLRVDEGTRVKVDDILEKVNKKFKSHSDIELICSDCEWKKECLFLLSKTFDM